VIPDSDLEALKSFDTRGSIALSAYLRLDTPEHRATAYERFLQLVQDRLDECGSDTECQEALQEDMEVVGIYLKTNGHRQHAGLAIFSCAAELFWRAYPLPVPVPTQVAVGPAFDLAPLSEDSG
jgi:hypothetical protein